MIMMSIFDLLQSRLELPGYVTDLMATCVLAPTSSSKSVLLATDPFELSITKCTGSSI
jgi:hypothetical protein